MSRSTKGPSQKRNAKPIPDFTKIGKKRKLGRSATGGKDGFEKAKKVQVQPVMMVKHLVMSPWFMCMKPTISGMTQM